MRCRAPPGLPVRSCHANALLRVALHGPAILSFPLRCSCRCAAVHCSACLCGPMPCAALLPMPCPAMQCVALLGRALPCAPATPCRAEPSRCPRCHPARCMPVPASPLLPMPCSAPHSAPFRSCHCRPMRCLARLCDTLRCCPLRCHAFHYDLLCSSPPNSGSGKPDHPDSQHSANDVALASRNSPGIARLRWPAAFARFPAS